MESGFITPTDKIKLEPHELVSFARDYCKNHNFEDFSLFAGQYNFVEPAYEYVLKVLKWIQIGTTAEPEPAYVLSVPLLEGMTDTLEVRRLVSDNYEDLSARKGKFLSKITFLSKFAFKDNTRNFNLKSGFVLQDGTLVSYKNYTHYLIAKALVNYLGANNEMINNYFSTFDDTCYEDLFVRLLGFIKVGNYGSDKVVMYTPELSSASQMRMIRDYEMMGFRIDEISPFDLESSKEMIKTLKF